MADRPQDTLTEQGDSPDMGALFNEYDQAWNNDDAVDTRLSLLEAIRYGRWDGQTADGLQHETEYTAAGREVLWPGAADTKILLVDDLVNGLVDLMVLAFNGAKMKTSPTTVSSISAAQTGELFTVLTFLKDGPLKKQLIDNVEISAQLTAMVGWCVLYPTWERRKVQVWRTITMEDLAKIAAQAQAKSTPDKANLLASLPQIVEDPEMEATAVEIFRTFFQEITVKEAKQHIRELRKTGQTEFPEVKERSIGPGIKVLCPWYHFVLPIEATARPDDARLEFVRAEIPPWKVDELAELEDLDPAWVEEVKKTAGQVQQPPVTREHDRDLNQNLCEIVWMFRTVFERGVRKKYCTVACPQVRGDKEGKHSYGGNWEVNVMTDDIFVYCRREATDWSITETRGVPDTTATNQTEMKNFRDATFNWTQLNVTPPIQRVGTAASKVPPSFGPFAIVESPTNKAWERLDLTSGTDIEVPFKLQELLRKEAEDRVGLERGDTVPARTVRKQQKLVSRFLAAWGQAFLMTAVLAYQNSKDELKELLGREPLLDAETLSKHLILMDYDVRTGDPAFLERLEKTITAILSAGLGNDLMLNKLVAWWLSLVDPNAAQEFLPQDQAPGRAAMKEVRDELNNVMMGNKPMLVEKDPAAKQKLQFMQQLMKDNPRYQRVLAEKVGGQPNPDFDANIAENFKTMVDNLQHSYQETVLSKAQGRLGVKKVG